MPRPTAAYVLMAILALTSLVLMLFSGPIPYSSSQFLSRTNPIYVMDYNIAYLFQLVKRLDCMLEVIYFGFLLALFWLGYAHGRLHMRLEALVEAWAQVKTAEEKHPAYGVGFEVLIARVEESERLRREDTMRIRELEGRIEKVVKRDSCHYEGEKEEMPPMYTSYAEMRALGSGGVYQGES
jgi:hypothetical protein